MVNEKPSKIVERGHTEKGPVMSLTSYFEVPKGDGDMRMVHNGTSCGLNDAVWAPNFFMPSVDTMTGNLDESSWMADLDLGEMFLNFPLEEMRVLVGVDLKPHFNKESCFGSTWGRRARMSMGFSPSPHAASMNCHWAEKLIRGNPRDDKSQFHWHCVKLNSPTSKITNRINLGVAI